MPTADRVLPLFILCTLLAAEARAAGNAVVIMRDRSVDREFARRATAEIESRRKVLRLRALPPDSMSPEEVANEERIKSIARALDRASAHEEVAAWTDCVKEAGDQLGTATAVLATSGRLDLLRDLHVQIGSCMSLAGQAADARTHFQTASVLDESPPQKGRHREEAELAHEEARAEVLGRAKGATRIETDPPGAEVWIDGRKLDGVTPLDADVRLGTHFVTLRRFRHEPETNQALLQPGSKLRFVLASARRDTLREQLGLVGAGKLKVSRHELRLARALWSRAPELVTFAKPPGPSVAVRVTLIDAESGHPIRSETIPMAADEETLRTGVCKLLGEPCEEPEGVSPHLIWPFAVVAAIGAAIAIGFVVDSQRDTVFCPPDGC